MEAAQQRLFTMDDRRKPDWVLPRSTKQAGLRGVAAARAVLAQTRPADEPRRGVSMPKPPTNTRTTEQLDGGEVVLIDGDPHYVVQAVQADPTRSDPTLHQVTLGHELDPRKAHVQWQAAAYRWTLAPSDRPMPGGTR